VRPESGTYRVEIEGESGSGRPTGSVVDELLRLRIEQHAVTVPLKSSARRPARSG
jgi:hypothetical protein